MGHLIGQIIFGWVVGIIAKFLMPGKDPGGFIITAIIGMVGALIGTFAGRALWGGRVTNLGGSPIFSARSFCSPAIGLS